MSRLKDHNNCSYIESLDDLSSHIKLTLEELDKKFIDAVLPKANLKFFTKEDPNCVYYKNNISELIQEKFKDYFENPELVNMEDTLVLGQLLFDEERMSNWIPVQKGMNWISNSQFDRIEDMKVYLWKSKITYVKLFKRKNQVTLIDIFSSKYHLLILPCFVVWKAEIRADGSFHNIEVDGINYDKGLFREPTSDEIKRYRLNKYIEDNVE